MPLFDYPAERLVRIHGSLGYNDYSSYRAWLRGLSAGRFFAVSIPPPAAMMSTVRCGFASGSNDFRRPSPSVSAAMR
jgi:hypothetical protein